MSTEERLDQLGLRLPKPYSPVGAYLSAVLTGKLLFVSGHGPMDDGQVAYRGKLGGELDIDGGYEAARLAALNCLATVKSAVGSLDRVRRVVKVVGYVAGVEGFVDHPKVINGASDVFEKVFGEAGRHARSAVGVLELPFGIPVEIETIVEIEEV